MQLWKELTALLPKGVLSYFWPYFLSSIADRQAVARRIKSLVNHLLLQRSCLGFVSSDAASEARAGHFWGRAITSVPQMLAHPNLSTLNAVFFQVLVRCKKNRITTNEVQWNFPHLGRAFVKLKFLKCQFLERKKI